MTKLMFKPEGRFIRVNDHQIHFIEQGSGPLTVLFVHGNSETALNWREVWSFMPADVHCVAFDLPGHGFSDRDWNATHSLRYIATVARGVLSALSIRRAVWVGHSLGGGVCLAGAGMFADDVLGLCLAASVGSRINRDRVRKGWSRLVPSRPRWWFRVFAERGPGARLVKRIMDRTIRVTMHPMPVDLSRQEWRRDCFLWSRSRHIIAATEDLRALIDSLDEIYPTYEQIRVPCEVISALEDRIIPREVGRSLVQRLPVAHLSEIPNAGHMLIRSHATEVAAAVTGLLERIAVSDLV